MISWQRLYLLPSIDMSNPHRRLTCLPLPARNRWRTSNQCCVNGSISVMASIIQALHCFWKLFSHYKPCVLRSQLLESIVVWWCHSCAKNPTNGNVLKPCCLMSSYMGMIEHRYVSNQHYWSPWWNPIPGSTCLGEISVQTDFSTIIDTSLQPYT